MYKAQELREESDEELAVKLQTLRRELFELRGTPMDSKAQKTHLIRQKRKAVARLLTIARERALKGV